MKMNRQMMKFIGKADSIKSTLILTKIGGCGALRFFRPECLAGDSGLPISLIVSYSSSNGFVLFTLSCDDPLVIVASS